MRDDSQDIKGISSTAYNPGFAAHFVRPNASHFAKPENVIPREIFMNETGFALSFY